MTLVLQGMGWSMHDCVNAEISDSLTSDGKMGGHIQVYERPSLSIDAFKNMCILHIFCKIHTLISKLYTCI
jgi:hypothetical protein